MEQELRFIWSRESSLDLKGIYDFYSPKSKTAAASIVIDIQEETESIKFPFQAQVDEFNSQYRRVFVRKHFRVIYGVDGEIINIIRVFDTRQEPSKMKS